LARAYAADGRHDDALREADWLSANRGRAYAEWGENYMWQPINVAESNVALLTAAEQAMADNKFETARQRLASFDAAWPKTSAIAEIATRRQEIHEKLALHQSSGLH